MANFNPPSGYQLDHNSGLYYQQFASTDESGQAVTVVNWFYPETGQISQAVYPCRQQNAQEMQQDENVQQMQQMQQMQQDESVQQMQQVQQVQQAQQPMHSQVMTTDNSDKKKGSPLFFILSAAGVLLASVAMLFLTGIIRLPMGDRYAAQHTFDPQKGTDVLYSSESSNELAMLPDALGQNELDMGYGLPYEPGTGQQGEIETGDASVAIDETQNIESYGEEYEEAYDDNEDVYNTPDEAYAQDSYDTEETGASGYGEYGYGDSGISDPYDSIDLSSMELDDLPNTKIKKVTATSELEPGSGKYAPKNLIDNNPKTAWVEGVSGEGMGEMVTFEFSEEVILAGFYIANGYFKSDAHYKENGKVSWINVVLDDGTQEMFDLNGSYLVAGTTNFSVQDYAFSNYVRFGKVHRVREVSFVIYSADMGTKYDDTCISEIGFLTLP